MTLHASRRIFLKSSALAGVVFGAAPRSLMRSVFAAEGVRSRRKTLVVVFQRGACDGLNTVIPFGDSGYLKARPSIGIKPPKQGDASTAIDLDGHFGLHPALADLAPLYRNGTLGFVHAIGSPDASRSHFDCQDFMESGTPGLKSTSDGWMNRFAGTLPNPSSKFRSVALTKTLPRVLRGASPAVALARVDDFQVHQDIAMSESMGGSARSGDRPRGKRGTRSMEGANRESEAESSAASFEKLYADAARDMLGNAGRETFEAIEALKSADPGKYSPRAGVAYPRGRLGESMKQMAQLIKADLGVELAFVDVGGWDHHTAEGSATGQLANLLRQLGVAVGAPAKQQCAAHSKRQRSPRG